MAELPAGGGSSNSPEEQESGSNGNSTEGTNRILVGRSRAGMVALLLLRVVLKKHHECAFG
eukprot:SAG31_NODE_641_length_13313_cov_5.365219_9_plen_61_part_00